MENISNKLATLLNDFYNSEASYYYNLKEKLINGFKFSFIAHDYNFKKMNFCEAFYIIHNYHQTYFDVGYSFSNLDHNIRFYLFEDDVYFLEIIKEEEVVFSGKDNFLAYSQLTIQPPYLPDSQKKYKFTMHLQLKKEGKFRKEFEHTFIGEGLTKYGWKKTKEIDDFLINVSKTDFNYYNDYAIILAKRLKLWNIKVKSNQEIIQQFESLSVLSLGIKDIVLLEYFEELFMKNVSNKKFLNALDKVKKSRIQFYEELCAKIK